jgi:hypothetical protein
VHIHGTATNLCAANLYSNAAAQKAAEAQRSADVRKRLLKNAARAAFATAEPKDSTFAESSSEELFLIGRWLDPRLNDSELPGSNISSTSTKTLDLF